MIVVVGDLVTDVVAALDGAPAAGTDTGARISFAGGGQGANTAAWLAARHAAVTLVASVGDDEAGRARVAELAAAGVQCAVRAHPGTPTGTVIVLTHGGERTMINDRGANLLLSPADVEAAVAAPGTRHVHVSGYPLLDPASRGAGLRALAAARGHGLSTSVDAASAGPLRRAGAAFLDWVRGVDLILANADEAAVLAGGSDPVAQSRALATVAVRAVVKRGPAGAVWAGPEGIFEQPGRPATVTDPTGAGDAFAAGLLAAWVGGAAPAEALLAGVGLGTEAVALLGARPR